jgi:CheY-like chemotaxis protein
VCADRRREIARSEFLADTKALYQSYEGAFVGDTYLSAQTIVYFYFATLVANYILLVCVAFGVRVWRERSGIFALSKVQVVSIIDDDASVRAGIESLVMSIGFVACVFESAEAFLRSSQLGETSCLITDVQMPGMSGLDLQSQLISRGLNLPIIFITGFPEQSARKRALDAGALAYLEKPFDGGAMTSLLRQVLGDPSA